MVKTEPPQRTLISEAFPGVQAPAELSAAVVTLVDLCRYSMPDPKKIRSNLAGADFKAGRQELANDAGRVLALDSKIVASPISNLRHEIFARGRDGVRVLILLSVGDSAEGQIVFCSSLFTGAIEADAVKAAAHVTELQPVAAGAARLSGGRVLRRVFWQLDGAAGVGGFVVSGPENVEAMNEHRAFIAFNKAGKRD